MSSLLPELQLQHIRNPAEQRGAPYGAAQRAILGGEHFKTAASQITRWPGYAKTPLIALNGLATLASINSIYYKHEASRFGLGSFKALGGAYAVSRLLIREIEKRAGVKGVDINDLLSRKYDAITSQVEVTCATDGNHGRSVAWGAERFGCLCTIYIHATVSQARADAIAAFGARVVRTDGNYDDSVRQAAEDAVEYGRFVVSDTSYPGYMDVPKDVMQGYAVMADEALQQLNGKLPTHVFLQGGVGGLAAAVVAHLWEKLGTDRPVFIVVEPDKAACLYESAKAGEPVSVKGDLDTVMAGLACGEVSLLAWEILKPGVAHFLTVDDQAALDTMCLLASGAYGESPIAAGESAVAGLAGLIGVLENPALRDELKLTADSCVLLFGSEGATDAALYQKIVGRTAQQVEQRQ